MRMSSIVILISLLLVSLSLPAREAERSEEVLMRAFDTVEVEGTGIHYLSTAVIHSTEPTATGMIQRSTDIVELEGDLVGRVLYHPVSVFDFAAGTLVNTGNQVFSGTVLGHGPVLLHDDEFLFEVDLGSGATTGQVYFNDRLAGPNIRCELSIVGTGLTPAGDPTVSYTGACRIKQEGKRAVLRHLEQK